MNLLICLRKGINELVICFTSATADGIPPTISHLFSCDLPSLTWLGSACLHVAAMPPLCVPFVPKKKREKLPAVFFVSLSEPEFLARNPRACDAFKTTRAAV